MTRPIRPGYLLNKFPAAAAGGGGEVLEEGDDVTAIHLGDGTTEIDLP